MGGRCIRLGTIFNQLSDCPPARSAGSPFNVFCDRIRARTNAARKKTSTAAPTARGNSGSPRVASSPYPRKTENIAMSFFRLRMLLKHRSRSSDSIGTPLAICVRRISSAERCRDLIEEKTEANIAIQQIKTATPNPRGDRPPLLKAQTRIINMDAPQATIAQIRFWKPD